MVELNKINCRIKYKDCKCFLEYTNFKDKLIEYKGLCCNKIYQKKIDENIKKRFFNTYKFTDIKKFTLLLRKSVYHYEYMNNCEELNEISLPEKKKDFCSFRNMEGITDLDSIHAKRSL